MIRRWACQRASLAVAGVGVLAVICALASWFIAGAVAPPTIAASVALEARGHQRNPMPPEHAESWRQWHVQLVGDADFHQILAKRMAERRLDEYASPQRLAARLQQDLTIDAAQDGQLLLTLAGTNRAETSAMLDALAATIAMQSNRQANARADNTPAVIPNERREDGVVRYASINPTPLQDHRFAVAGPIFGVLLAACIALFVFLYVRLIKARRVFDEEEVALMME